MESGLAGNWLFSANLMLGFLGAVFGFFVLWVIWVYKDKLHDAGMMLGLALLVLSVPFGVRLVSQRTQTTTPAETEAALVSVQVSLLDEYSREVRVKLSAEAELFGEYTDLETGSVRPIVPEYQTEKRTEHVLVITAVGKSGGELILVVGGRKMYVEGEPIRVN